MRLSEVYLIRVISKDGESRSLMTFYVKECAEIFNKIYGGEIIHIPLAQYDNGISLSNVKKKQ